MLFPDDDPSRRRIVEAVDVLTQLDFPRAQRNDRTGLTLLALLDLRPDDPWSDARQNILGLHGITQFIVTNYGRGYKENTRETIRDDSVAPMVNAGLVIPNPDKPDRAKNSPKFCYGIELAALDLLRTYGADAWSGSLAAYRASRASLAEHYRRVREETMIYVPLSGEEQVRLSPGGQNILIEQILRLFRPRFSSESEVLYIGDSADKFRHLKTDRLAELGVSFTRDSKIPDVILYDAPRNWLLLIEAAFSGGPVDGKRYDELRELFRHATSRLIMVTAFETRRALTPYMESISWESEVWFADEPDHLVHWNGPKFLRPFEDE